MLPVLSLNGLGTVLKNLEPVAGALFGLSSSVFSAFFFHMLIASLGSPKIQAFKILIHQVEINYKTRVRLDYVTILNRIWKLNFKF